MKGTYKLEKWGELHPEASFGPKNGGILTFLESDPL